MPHLQIEIDIDADRKAGYEIKATPVDIALPEAALAALRSAIAIADQTDDVPNDGQYEKKTHIKAPVRINLFIAKINTSVDLDGQIVIRVKD